MEERNLDDIAKLRASVRPVPIDQVPVPLNDEETERAKVSKRRLKTISNARAVHQHRLAVQAVENTEENSAVSQMVVQTVDKMTQM